MIGSSGLLSPRRPCRHPIPCDPPAFRIPQSRGCRLSSSPRGRGQGEGATGNSPFRKWGTEGDFPRQRTRGNDFSRDLPCFVLTAARTVGAIPREGHVAAV